MKLTGVGLLLALLVVGCGGEADVSLIETEIERDLGDQIGSSVTVDCPDQIDWRTGGEFHCFATDEAGTPARVTVTMENDDGEWAWVVG